MPKKRIIFTLLYSNKSFFISRNFNLQKIGNIDWLNKNYNFKEIANAIDELILLNVGNKDDAAFDEFCEVLKNITREIFVPVSAGGGINDIHRAKKILRSGADKVIINSIALNEPNKLDQYINFFGSQCIIISLDLIRNKNNMHNIWDNNQKKISKISLNDYVGKINKHNFGEIYLTSIDKDGTGQGYDFQMLESLNNNILTPIIISGGAGNWKHLHEGLLDKRVDAVSTANLLNFVDKGLINSRNNILSEGFDLPIWA